MRLFVAIELNEAIKKELQAVQDQLAEFNRTVRWAKPEQIHLTLKFLGEVPDQDTEGICQAAEEVASQCPPFELRLAECGCFPPRGPVRIVHVAVEDGEQTLQHCRDLCEEAYEKLGFACEVRPFSPHLTIGRVREDRTRGQLRSAIERASCKQLVQSVNSLCVVQSQLHPQGARYANVVCHELTGT